MRNTKWRSWWRSYPHTPFGLIAGVIYSTLVGALEIKCLWGKFYAHIVMDTIVENNVHVIVSFGTGHRIFLPLAP